MSDPKRCGSTVQNGRNMTKQLVAGCKEFPDDHRCGGAQECQWCALLCGWSSRRRLRIWRLKNGMVRNMICAYLHLLRPLSHWVVSGCCCSIDASLDFLPPRRGFYRQRHHCNLLQPQYGRTNFDQIVNRQQEVAL